MGNTLLSLPIDVPWKRLAITQQMYAPSIDTPLPPKWESSVAVYAYEPAPDPALDDPTEKTTFLKIVATVTGFEPIDFSYQFPYMVNPIYFPAYSALIQLAVFPHGRNPDPESDGVWPTEEYPYVADCQPQKRELTETTTEGGEVVTQSATDANIRKSMTNTNKQELTGGYPISTTLGTQGESQDIRTTDALQESRQTNSYSTQISQLYHLLDSYHTGTNRVIFFINARPHLVVSDFTFAQGPRNLEGIQEFLVLVRRPAAMDGICVKAVLETAHLYKWDVTTTPPQLPPQQATTTLQAHLRVFADGSIIGQQPPPHTNSVTLTVPPGFQLDTSKGGGDVQIQIALSDHSTATTTMHLPPGVWIGIYAAIVQEGSQLEAVPQVTVSADGMTITVSATAQGWGNIGDTAGKIDCDVYVYAKEPPPQITPHPVTKHFVQLFTTAREASGCISSTDGIQIMPGTNMTWVGYEGTLDPTAADAYQIAMQAAAREATIAANRLNRMVATGLKTSMGDPARYAPGHVPFASSRIAIQMLLGAMGRTVIATRLAGTTLLLDLKLTDVDPGSQAFVDGITESPVELRQKLIAALAPHARTTRKR
jgi:hypothetical protein